MACCTVGQITRSPDRAAGQHVVNGVAPADGSTDVEILRLVGAVEAENAHPLARAVLAAAQEHDGITRASGFRSLPGRGVKATIDRVTYKMGGPRRGFRRGRSKPPGSSSPVTIRAVSPRS